MIISEKRICFGIWAILLFLIFLEPASFTDFKVTDLAFEIANLFVMVLVAFFFFQPILGRKKVDSKRKISKIPCLILLYYLYLTAVTLIYGGNIGSCIMQMIRFAGFTMYIDLVCKYNPKILYTTGLNILTLYTVINCITCFAFPDGLYSTVYFDNNFFLGYDNQNINFILPALILVLIKHQYYKKCKLQILFTYFVGLATIIKVWSAMSLIIVMCTAVFAFFFFKRKTRNNIAKVMDGRVFNLSNLIIFNMASVVALLFFNIQDRFQEILTVLHKSTTLSGRRLAWERYINLARQRPLFGYGKEVATERNVKLGFSALSAPGLHAHNRYLETFYSGGVILLAIYIYILFYTARCLKSIRDTSFAKIMTFGIFIYLMAMLTEQYEYCLFFWGFLAMAENGKIYKV